VYPTVRVIPPTRMELDARKYSVLTFPTNTVIGSQAGLPSLTVPVGFTEDGLPIGMELLGTPLSEARMLQFAYSCERAFQARRTPGLHPGP
jgi:amidase